MKEDRIGDSLGRQYYEERQDYSGGQWSNRYDITQAYDKNGNRTGYDKNVAGGYNSDYGKAYNLSYAFNSVNALTAISDGDDPNYGCSVTCDANGNITEVDESELGKKPTPQTNYLYSYFTYDALNRLTEHKTKAYVAGGTNAWVLTRRTHAYDALGRLTQSGWRSYNDGGADPGPTNHRHAYSGSRFVQNVSSDGGSFGARWHWTSSGHSPSGQPELATPLRLPNPDTASRQAYDTGHYTTPQRRTFINPTTEGDQRHLFGQGRPMAKDSSGSGASWYQGTISAIQNANQNPVESRLFFEGTVTTSLDRATDAREKGRIGLFGTGFSYAASYARVTSESIGRDLNPLGRGDGMGYVGGSLSIGLLTIPFPGSNAQPGEGNSVNNPWTADLAHCTQGCVGQGHRCTRLYTNHRCIYPTAPPHDLCIECCYLANGYPTPWEPMCDQAQYWCHYYCDIVTIEWPSVPDCHVCCEQETAACWEYYNSGQCLDDWAHTTWHWQCPGCGGSPGGAPVRPSGGPSAAQAGARGGSRNTDAGRTSASRRPKPKPHPALQLPTHPVFAPFPFSLGAPFVYCARLKSYLREVAILALDSCCELFRAYPDYANLQNYDPCCHTGLADCIKGLDFDLQCDYYELWQVLFNKPDAWSNASPTVCRVHVSIGPDSDPWALADGLLHELSHCCGTEHFPGDPTDRVTGTGWGKYQGINAFGVGACVGLLRDVGGGSSIGPRGPA